MMHDRQREFGALVAWVASQSRPKLDYSQLSHSDLLYDYVYLFQLTHQASYMILFRTCSMRLEVLPHAIEWQRGLTIPASLCRS